ncbi:hypothetical protein B0H14DRAFT_3562324 [Mycena olivaceomarginata]|nr:hypothetical protein B0H14DRAFT_3562324 [Mycena olivaceomarginata]
MLSQRVKNNDVVETIRSFPKGEFDFYAVGCERSELVCGQVSGPALQIPGLRLHPSDPPSRNPGWAKARGSPPNSDGDGASTNTLVSALGTYVTDEGVQFWLRLRSGRGAHLNARHPAVDWQFLVGCRTADVSRRKKGPRDSTWKIAETPVFAQNTGQSTDREPDSNDC